MDLKDKKLIFVTGKGGVGKSLMAATIALREARLGRRVCLAELGQQSFYESFFETRGITYEPSEVIPQVHVALLSPEECLKEYALHYLKVPKLYDLLFQNKVMRAFINAAPALPELSILGKVTSDIRGIIQSEYDLIVVDCYSTGHALALLRAPRGLGTMFKVGALNEQASGIDKTISDPRVVKFFVVTLPEELPVNETRELAESLRTEFHGDISIICNLIAHSGLTDQEKKKLKDQLKETSAQEFLDYITAKEEGQRKQMQRLKEYFGEFIGVRQILKNVKGQELMEDILPQLENSWDLTNS